MAQILWRLRVWRLIDKNPTKLELENMVWRFEIQNVNWCPAVTIFVIEIVLNCITLSAFTQIWIKLLSENLKFSFGIFGQLVHQKLPETPHYLLHISPQAQNLPLRTAAVWSGVSNASHWAAEGAWGNLQNRQSAGFWDDAVGGASNKKSTASSNKWGEPVKCQ